MASGTRLCARAAYTVRLCGAGIWRRNQSRVEDRLHQSVHRRKASTRNDSKGSRNDLICPENPEFSWNQVFLQWALGVYFSTPLIAILQGSLLLNDYRVNHSDAPRPVMPARGVAVAIDEDRTKSISSWILHPFSSSSNHTPGNERPLRLLVVGDSLAAGVGMSKSGVPILPESIARSLSKEMGGRAVYWTCVGTPGVSAAQLVKDIEEIEPYDPHPKGRQLERIVKEFQNRRRRWLERHANNDIEYLDPAVPDSEVNDVQQQPQNPILKWWKRMREKEKFDSAEIPNNPQGVLNEWWSNVRLVFRKRKQLVEEDLSAIKDIVLKPLPQLDDDEDDYYYDYFRENLPPEDILANERDVGSVNKDDNHSKSERIPLIHKGTLFRRTSVVSKAAAEYDIAVVLTGLNDVKEAFMPHMNKSSGQGPTKLNNSLRQVLEALKEKMHGNLDLEHTNRKRNSQDQEKSTNTFLPSDGLQKASNVQQSSENPKNMRHPLVVVPELPVAPLQFFRLVPLCWFLIPIFRAMENNKRFLASCFPDNVVFVHQPDLEWWTDEEMGIGSIRKNIKNEQLLLRVTDSVRSVRERIEEVMKNYYGPKEEESLSSESKSKSDHDQSCSISSLAGNNSNASPDNKGNIGEGRDFVSVDGIHPNDEGYELWGRHIAAAIIDHWNKVDRQ